MPKSTTPKKGEKQITRRAFSFVQELKKALEGNQHFTFFLGAGASKSSGIPMASELVDTWLREMYENQFHDGKEYGKKDPHLKWAEEFIEGFDRNDPAASYPIVIEKYSLNRNGILKYLTVDLVERTDPGPAYGILAKLMTHTKYGENCNRVLTTNFDDLVADAIHLFTKRKPLTVNDHSSAHFIKSQDSRPLIVKLHGDAKSKPRHTTEQINDELEAAYQDAMKAVLGKTGLIFLGYGGNDQTIIQALNNLPDEMPEFPVYWVNDVFPQNEFGEWLEKVSAVWVKHRDFDELMLLVHEAFDLTPPDWKRFKKMEDEYLDKFKAQAKQSEESVDEDVKVAASRAFDEAKAWEHYNELISLNSKSISIWEPAYHKAMLDFPGFHPIVQMLAYKYCETVGYEEDGIKYCNKAIELDPEDYISMANCASLKAISGFYLEAAEYYERALNYDPLDIDFLNDYATSLSALPSKMKEATEIFENTLRISKDDLGNQDSVGRLYVSYAGHLLRLGEGEKGKEYLDKANLLVIEDKTKLHFHFVNFIYFINTEIGEKSYEEISRILQKGVRIHKGSFSLIMQWASSNWMTKNFNRLKELVDRISTPLN